MNGRHGRLLAAALLALILLAGPGASADEYYYGIKINDILCGYARFDISPQEIDGKKLDVLEQNVFLMISALGAEFNSEMTFVYHIDPVTGQFVFHSSDIDQGGTKMDSEIRIEDGKAIFSSSTDPEQEPLELPDGLILENTMFFPHLKREMYDAGIETKTFKVYDVREHKIHEKKYTLKGTEKLELGGKEYDVFLVEGHDLDNGLKAEWWLDTSSGRLLKALVLGNREIYLDDRSVTKRIKLANLDGTIFTKANVSIADVPAITYMKVRGVLEPVGLNITAEGLNVPGQGFEGTVVENRIEGVFEIGHERYDGEGAPPFPFDYGDREDLKEYLEPSAFLESEDPVLVEKARSITEGSADSWEAAVRLSSWVADNINYAIPGGVTARKTYDIRAGECGSHSNLLGAFCRAVGIPARVVWGCMYVPNMGGAFGQHAWTEIYIEGKGWIPVDATADEPDFVDSGHIRISTLESATIALNAKEFEILDHRLGAERPPVSKEEEEEKFGDYTGEFTGPMGRVFEVIVWEGNLTVNIPNQVKLALNEPDETGRWYAKMTNRVFVTFGGTEEGKIDEMAIHELVPVPRTAEADTMYEGIPEDYIPYLGKYYLAAIRGDFNVIFHDGRLAVDDSLNKTVVHLVPTDEKGRFLDEYGKNYISFRPDEEGGFNTMEIESISRFNR